MFRRIVFSAVVAGLVAGILLTGIQQLQVVPAILEAETYEAPESGATAHAHADGLQHEHGSWAPGGRTGTHVLDRCRQCRDGGSGSRCCSVRRFLFRDNVNWRQGMLWGLGGYAAFFALPALGLTPELPGTEATGLQGRQAWWLGHRHPVRGRHRAPRSRPRLAVEGGGAGADFHPSSDRRPAPGYLHRPRSLRAPADVHRRHRHRQRRVLGRAGRGLRNRLQEARLTRTSPHPAGGPGPPRHRAGQWRE